MQKCGVTLDTIEKLRCLLAERGWTEYRLAKKCGLNQSTIANIFRRNTVPSIATLAVICKGFGIVAVFCRRRDGGIDTGFEGRV